MHARTKFNIMCVSFFVYGIYYLVLCVWVDRGRGRGGEIVAGRRNKGEKG